MNRELLVLATVVTAHSVSAQTIWGVKSVAPGGVDLSAPPSVLFRLATPDSSGYLELDTLTINGALADVDGMAQLPDGQLIAWHRMGSSTAQMVSVDSVSGELLSIGLPLTNREIRGACSDPNGNLWAVDVIDTALLLIDHNDGTVLSSRSLTVNGTAWSNFGACDIVFTSGGYFASNLDTLYSLDTLSGNLTIVNVDMVPDSTDSLYTCAGPDTNPPPAAIGLAWDTAMNALIALDGNCEEDVFAYSLSDLGNRIELYENIVPQFNSGGGDLASRPASPPPALTGLIAFFPFDETLIDTVQQLTPSDSVGVPQYCANAIGEPGTAICFDGSTLFSYGDTLNMGIEDFVVSFWFNLDTVAGIGPGYSNRLVNKGGTLAGTPANAGWMTNFEQVEPDSFTFEFSTNDAATIPVDSIEVGITTDEWHHTLYRRCGNTHQLYLDCQLVGQFDTLPGQNLHVNTYFALGGLDRRPGSNTFDGFFQGALDQLRIYRGTCLGANDMTFLCTELIGTDIAQTTPVEVELRFTPNPARQYVRLDWRAGAQSTNSAIDLRNAIGQVVGQYVVDSGSSVELDTAHLPLGAYFVTLQGEKWQAHGRFIKE